MAPLLDLIDLDQPTLEGQRRFISCWVCRGPEITFIVDPGPPSTAAALVARLHAMDVDRLDYVLLTHIHLDHAGATAEILAAFPGARVLCHEIGRPHLVAPQCLWEGSRQVLGRTAEVYGAPAAVSPEALADEAELAAHGVLTVPTPGHAAHHLCFVHADTLFAGEAAGTFLALPEDAWYLRPATPPRFVPAVALASLDRLLALDPLPARVAFAHHGRLEGRTRDLLRLAREQLSQWVAAAGAVVRQMPGAGIPALTEACLGRLALGDPHFALRVELPPDIQVRELQFTRQTLRGILLAVGALDAAGAGV
jgi:glyoxylase-like metal-dependent hydrolase (beta-lactamase superfamily II)